MNTKEKTLLEKVLEKLGETNILVRSLDGHEAPIQENAEDTYIEYEGTEIYLNDFVSASYDEKTDCISITLKNGDVIYLTIMETKVIKFN